MVAQPKRRQHFPLDNVPADLSRPISRALPGAAAIKSETLRRFQVALEYFDIPEPRDQLHRTRLLRAFYLVFPAAFWAPCSSLPRTKVQKWNRPSQAEWKCPFPAGAGPMLRAIPAEARRTFLGSRLGSWRTS
jgi:hypothetical protein